jgi:exosortase D (VPLPA-CTERM-specific)
LLLIVTGACLLVVFRDALGFMVARWTEPHYLHGYLVPLVVLWLAAAAATPLASQNLRGSGWGMAVLLAGLGLQVLGRRSAVFELAEYGFVVSLWGLGLAGLGWRGTRSLWMPAAFLLWMVPLANFIEKRLFGGLASLSGTLGESLLRAAGYSALAEGNGVDLGNYVLPLARACTTSGFILALLCLASLLAILARGRWWQRLGLILWVVPAAILLDGLRIFAIGVRVDRAGAEGAAELLGDGISGALLAACVASLLGLAWFLGRGQGRPLRALLSVPVPEARAVRRLLAAPPGWPAWLATLMVLAATGLSLFYTPPPTRVPERAFLDDLPLRMDEWNGSREFVDRAALEILQATDYSMTAYSRSPGDRPVGLWIVYYAAQVQGMAVHSPQACLPGSGWRIESLEPHTVPGAAPDGGPLRVNRVMIAMGEQRQLVYYWFAQRGRTITNEFLVKWFIFWDGLTMNRTDGALVRVTTEVRDLSRVGEADARLEAFVQAASPRLAPFLPDAGAPAVAGGRVVR